MCGWCLAYCTGVVLNTVWKSATPDSKENKQADAGSRRFRRHFLCGALLCNFLSTEHEGLSTHVQRECSAEPFYAQHSVTKNLHISPRFSLTIFYQHWNSISADSAKRTEFGATWLHKIMYCFFIYCCTAVCSCRLLLFSSNLCCKYRSRSLYYSPKQEGLLPVTNNASRKVCWENVPGVWL